MNRREICLAATMAALSPRLGLATPRADAGDLTELSMAQASRALCDGRTTSRELTAAFNTPGLPAISVPCGVSPAGLPIGLMICGPRYSEGRLLALAWRMNNQEKRV